MYTQEEYEKIVYENNPNVKVIGSYTKMRDKIECQCLICNKPFYANAYDIRIGKMHRQCSYNVGTKKRTKTHDQFIEEVSSISPNINIIGKYINAKTKIECMCVKHNVRFYISPDKLLIGQSGCDICMKEKISEKNCMSENEFLDKVSNNKNNIEIKGTYTNTKTPILVRCNICGHEWSPVAESVIAGHGCPKCSGRIITSDDFKNKVYNTNPYIDIISEYNKSSEKILCRCRICNKTWKPIAYNLFHSGCPYCKMSHGEREIMKWLDDNNIEYIWQYKFDDLIGVHGGFLSYDFYLIKHNMLIEYQGEFHDHTVKIFMQSEDDYEIQKEHDRRKEEYANNHNIDLLEIWYYDYDNIVDILERKIALNKDPVEITVA